MRYPILILIFLLPLLLNASWVEQYQKGEYPKAASFLYAMVQEDADTDAYLAKAQEGAMADIARQIYSEVSSEQSMVDKLIDDERSEDYRVDIHVISAIPVHGASKVEERTDGRSYYLLLALDKQSAGRIYAAEAKRLAQRIDSAYKDYQNTKSLEEKERLLGGMSSDLANYETYALVARTMEQHGITEPSVSRYTIEKAIAALDKHEAVTADELATLLAKGLFKTAVKERVEILPFAYEASKSYSSFSSEFQGRLEGAASKMVSVSRSSQSPLKVAGEYFLKEGSLVVNARLYDASGHVKATATARMKGKVKGKVKGKEYYLPKPNAYSGMDAAVLDDKLNVQARINGKQEGLLFRKGETVRLDVKVSQKAYLYVIANMRTKAGKQVQYLLSISDYPDKAQYSKFIPYQNSNLWVTLAEFEVFAPFGAEALHLFASSEDILDKLPESATKRIDGEEYEGVIIGKGGAILEAARSIALTRGLKPKKDSQKKRQLAETVLRFTTVER